MATPVTVGPQAEETIRRAGLRALRAALAPPESSFPTRPNGTPLLLKQSVFERLLSGKMQLSSFPASDISAAQGDVKHLSLAQLLAVWTSQGDLPAGTTGPLGAFLSAVDAAATEQLAKRLEASAEVAQLVQLVYGARASAELPEAEHWLLRVPGTADKLLHLPSCELRVLEDIPALAHSSVSKAGGAVPKERRKLHWEVQLCEKPSEFKERAPTRMSMAERRASGEARRSLPGRGYPKSAPKAAEAEAASEEEETASEESDDEVQPGSRPRVAAAGLCTTAQAQALGDAPKEVASEQLSKLREELKASADAEARANEASEELRRELAAAKEAEVEAAARAEQLRADLAAAKESEVEAVACAEQLRADLAAAKEGQVEAAACAEELRADLAAAKEGEAKAVACAEQLRADLAAAKEGEAEAAACAEKLRAELAAPKESQVDPEEVQQLRSELAAAKAAADDESAKLRAELTSARDAEALAADECAKLQRELASARDAEALAATEVEKLQKEVTSARDAEARVAEEVARLEVEVKTARDAEAQAIDEAAAVRQGTDPVSDLQWNLLAAKDTEASLREQLAEAKAAEAKAVAEATEARRALADATASSPSRGTDATSRALQEQLAAAASAAEDADRLTESLQQQIKARDEAVGSRSGSVLIFDQDDDAESFASADSHSQGFVSPLKPSPQKGS